MAKVKPPIPVGKFFLPTRTNAKGESAIYLKYHLDGYLKRSTGINILPSAWDDTKGCVKASYPQAAQINFELQNFKQDIDKKLVNYTGEITKTVLSFILNGGDPNDAGDLPDESATQVANKKTSFVAYAKSVNDLNYGKKEYGYSLWYNKQKLIEQFETFLIYFRKTPKVALKDLRQDIFDEYVQYRFTVRKNTNKEAVNKALVPLYVAIKAAITNGILDQGTYGPIAENYLETRETEYRPDMEDTVVEKVRYLKPEQSSSSLIKRNVRIPVLKRFWMWFFAYYACGLRLSDVMTLEWKHIDWEAKVLKKVQFKTKRLPDVLPPLGKSALEILERWKEKGRNSRFVFDLLKEDYDLTDQKRLFMDRNSKDKTFNTSLNVARMTLRFDFPLTMHVARHSFAVMCINEGMNIFLLSKLLGHSTIASTQRTVGRGLIRRHHFVSG